MINTTFESFENDSSLDIMVRNNNDYRFIIQKRVDINNNTSKDGSYSIRITENTYIKIVKPNKVYCLKSIDFTIPLEPEEEGFKVQRELCLYGDDVIHVIYRYDKFPTAQEVAEHIIRNYIARTSDITFQPIILCKLALSE